MTDTEYDKLKQQAERDYHANLAAIDRVWRMSRQLDTQDHVNGSPIVAARQAEQLCNPPTTQSVNLPLPFTPPERDVVRMSKKGAILRAVREIVSVLNGDFTTNEVFARLNETNDVLAANKGTVKGIMAKLAREGVLEIVRSGIGRSPTFYRRKNTTSEG